MTGRPQVGGFPDFAETLRRAGVERNCWYLPSCQSLYLTEEGSVMVVMTPLVSGCEVDFSARTVRYYFARGEEYVEVYPFVAV